MGVDNQEVNSKNELFVLGKFASLISRQADKMIALSELAGERGIDLSSQLVLSEYAEYQKTLQELDEKLISIGTAVRSELKENGIDDPDLELRNHLEQKNKGL